MPTGFTAPIFDRDDYTFREYLWSCMRYMGVAYAIRDDADLSPITTDDIARMKAAESDEYHVNRLAEAGAEMSDVLARPASWWVEDAARKNAAGAKEYKRAVASSKERRAKIDAMLTAVDEWHPPTPEHEGFKRFMREQLIETMRFDCCVPEPPVEVNADTHREQVLAHLAHDMTYHREEIKKARANATARAAWIDAVVAITPPPA